jgi:hypothetical protein
MSRAITTAKPTHSVHMIIALVIMFLFVAMRM